MSLENHPNFHAVNFVSKLVEAYHESLRGKASMKNYPEVDNLFIDFTAKVEEMVDKYVDEQGANLEIEKLNIKEGDFVVVKNLSREDAYRFGLDLECKIPPKATICFLQDGQTIETMDEKEMEKSGWVRKKNRSKL